MIMMHYWSMIINFFGPKLYAQNTNAVLTRLIRENGLTLPAALVKNPIWKTDKSKFNLLGSDTLTHIRRPQNKEITIIL